MSDDNNIESVLPKSPDECFMLEKAIVVLLNRIPETWELLDQKVLTSIEQRALFLLTAAGLIERRLQFRVTPILGSFAADIEIVATGEFGFVQAMQTVILQMWSDCRDVYESWVKEHGVAPTSQCELLGESWRLTDQGVIAKQDLSQDSRDRQYVFDFVLKRGTCNNRPATGGSGKLLKLTRNDDSVDTTPSGELPQVAVANWDDGCDIFADRFLKILGDAMAAGKAKPPIPEDPVVSLEPPQIQIGSNSYALTDDAAHYLQVLNQHYGERMSDREVIKTSEFLAATYRDRPRLKHVRDSIPFPVQEWIDSNESGTKLRRPV